MDDISIKTLKEKEEPEICHKACLGKNKLDTKTELKKNKTIQYDRIIQDGGHFSIG
jgi:hypothetical protein